MFFVKIDLLRRSIPRIPWKNFENITFQIRYVTNLKKGSRRSRREYDTSGIPDEIKKKKKKNLESTFRFFKSENHGRLLTIAGERNSTISALASTFANGPSIWGWNFHQGSAVTGSRNANTMHAPTRSFALVPRELSTRPRHCFVHSSVTVLAVQSLHLINR